MGYIRLWSVLFGYVIVLLAVPALGCYSGLTLIPTAETAGSGQYSLELQTDKTVSSSGNALCLFNTEAAVSERCEVGVDFDISEESTSRAMLNGKYIFAQDQQHGTTFAVGTFNVARGFKQSPYVVATRGCSGIRLHFGGMRIEGNNRWFTGVDFGMGERWTLMADYTSGDENYSSLGVNYQFDPGFGIVGGAMFSNSGDQTVYSVHFCFGGSYRSPIGST